MLKIDKEFIARMKEEFNPASYELTKGIVRDHLKTAKEIAASGLSDGSGLIGAARGRVKIYLLHQENPDDAEYQLQAQLLQDEISEVEAILMRGKAA
jgi:hypothetical protein